MPLLLPFLRSCLSVQIVRELETRCRGQDLDLVALSEALVPGYPFFIDSTRYKQLLKQEKNCVHKIIGAANLEIMTLLLYDFRS